MTYQATMTVKGQITIPKPVRDLLGLVTSRKIQLSVMPNKSGVVIKPTYDFLEIAKRLPPQRPGEDVLKAREAFETQYERF